MPEPIVLYMTGRTRSRWWLLRTWRARRRARKEFNRKNEPFGISLQEWDQAIVALHERFNRP